ncbi:hypothetical protein NMY22_g12600 [Coprinellus aureogranulatus]|nr:hypothetical protein NMY22_g12600 [Coprinellus aureogranulatus]
MEGMPNIHDFELGRRLAGASSGVNRPLAFAQVASSRWGEAILALIHRRCLKTIRLSYIDTLPLEALSNGIQDLYMTHSSCLSFQPELRAETSNRITLRCLGHDTLSMISFIDIYLERALRAGRRSRPPRIGLLDLSKIERLSIVLQVGNSVIYAPLLRQTVCLQELEFIGETSSSLCPIISTLFLNGEHKDSPLHTSTPHPDLSSPNSRPYPRLLNGAFAQLVALERLCLDIVVQGFLDLDPQSFEPARWARLSEILAMPGACPNLREVAISVQIRVSDTPYELRSLNKSFKECKGDAERLVGMFSFPPNFKLEQAQWRWNGGISAIIGNPQLRTLRLEDVFAMPIDQLPSGLRELHSRRATFGNALNERRTSTRKRKQIQVLSCDTLSALSLGVYYKEDLTPFGVDLSQLKKLSFHLQLRVGTQLIRQSRCLEELELTTHQSYSGATALDFSSPPMSNLQPASLATLSSLTVCNFRYCQVGDRNDLLGCPYTPIAIVEELFMGLTALETLRFDIILQGHAGRERRNIRCREMGSPSQYPGTTGFLP